jgi:hypothetical protein
LRVYPCRGPRKLSGKNCLNRFKGRFGSDGGFKDSFGSDGGFKDRFAIVWFAPILSLLIEFLPFSADVRKGRAATIRVVQAGSCPRSSKHSVSLGIP